MSGLARNPRLEKPGQRTSERRFLPTTCGIVVLERAMNLDFDRSEQDQTAQWVKQSFGGILPKSALVHNAL